MKTIQRDCRVLESFKIMDYSLLVGVHNLDLALKEKQEMLERPPPMPVRQISLDAESELDETPNPDAFLAHERDREETNREDKYREEYLTAEAERERIRERGIIALNRSKSINRQRLVAHSTAMESIQAESEPIDLQDDVP